MGYLVYHPQRQRSVFDQLVVYHDSVRHNQDPYVWNDRFLHSYCHITQMKPEVGNIILWVCGDKWPEFDHLYCDLVFTIIEKTAWKERNHILENDPIVDSIEAYDDHYSWVYEHPFKKRQRFTLKADPALSFQPQKKNGDLVDIIPWLVDEGFDLNSLRTKVRAGRGAQPMQITDATLLRVRDKLSGKRYRQIYGKQLRKLREDDKTWKEQVSRK